jgi:hypothetical protein
LESWQQHYKEKHLLLLVLVVTVMTAPLNWRPSEEQQQEMEI